MYEITKHPTGTFLNQIDESSSMKPSVITEPISTEESKPKATKKYSGEETKIFNTKEEYEQFLQENNSYIPGSVSESQSGSLTVKFNILHTVYKFRSETQLNQWVENNNELEVIGIDKLSLIVTVK